MHWRRTERRTRFRRWVALLSALVPAVATGETEGQPQPVSAAGSGYAVEEQLLGAVCEKILTGAYSYDYWRWACVSVTKSG